MKVLDKAESCSVETIHEEEVSKARKVLPYPFVLEELAEFFKVLTDPTRLRLLYALGSGELCVCDLSAVTGATVSSVSHHLAALRHAKLVKSRRDGRIIYYSLADVHVHQIIGYAREHLTE